MTYDYSEFLSTLVADKIVDLSATTVALCLSALNEVSFRNNWRNNGEKLTSVEWDNLEAIIGLAYEELMSSLVGLILPHVMSSVSAFKMLPCDGSVYNKADYPLLYDAIDPIYIVSGTQFSVPDLRDRTIVGTGANYALNDSGGVDSVTLTIAQMPPHAHTYTQPTFGIDIEAPGVPDPTGVGNPPVPQQTTSAGGGNSHENRMPYRALNYAIIAG